MVRKEAITVLFTEQSPNSGGEPSVTLPSHGDPREAMLSAPICWAAGPRVPSSCPCVITKSVITREKT